MCVANVRKFNAVSSTCNDNPEKAYKTVSNPGAVSFDSNLWRHRTLRDLGRLDLSKRVAREPALTGLIKVYEEHYPEAFSGEKLAGRTFSFSVSSLGNHKLNSKLIQISILTLTGVIDYTRFKKQTVVG